MKQLLIILFLSPALCWGQKKDSGLWATNVQLDRVYFLNDSMMVRLFVSKEGDFFADTIPNKDTLKSKWTDASEAKLDGLILHDTTISPFYYDTIPVLLLCIDTAKYYKGNENGWYETEPSAFWGHGYIVIERYSTWLSAAIRFQPSEPTFLDRRKKPLEKNIVVFMTKEIN